MNLFAQAIISGLMTGGVYTLLGIGLILPFRTARVLNLAHGETFAIAGIVAALLTAKGLPMWAALSVAGIASVAFATGLHFFVLRPQQGRALGSLILITLAAAFIVRGSLFLMAGPDPVSFPLLFSGMPLRIAGGAFPRQGLALVIFAFACSAGVGLFLSATRSGKQMLATAEDPFAAELLGINVEKSRLIAYGVSGLFGALAAILLVPLIAIDFQSGLAMTLRGFVAAAISGMSPLGVVASGFALGLCEALVGAYLGSLFQDPLMFLMLILVALWRSRAIRFGGGQRA